MIDLEKYSVPTRAIVPIINGKGVYRGRKFASSRADDLYWCRFGDEVTIDYPSTSPIDNDKMLSELPMFRGIVYGNSIIPLNFGSAKFLGYEESTYVNFMNAELGMVIIVRRWEDGSLLFHKVDMSSKHQLMCIGVKGKAEKGELLDDTKGITPEMRYFYVMLILDKQRIEKWEEIAKLELSKKEKEKRIAEFKATFAGRLQEAVTNAGGKLVLFNVRGNKIDVKWIMRGEIFSSVIRQDLRVLELGFCAEGHDKDHSISSAIQLAKDFEERGLIYKTRE